MIEDERENENALEERQERALGLELLFFVIGMGVVIVGLMLAFTGIGALIGIGVLFLGGLICLLGSTVGAIVGWRISRHKES